MPMITIIKISKSEFFTGDLIRLAAQLNIDAKSVAYLNKELDFVEVVSYGMENTITALAIISNYKRNEKPTRPITRCAGRESSGFTPYQRTAPRNSKKSGNRKRKETSKKSTKVLSKDQKK